MKKPGRPKADHPRNVPIRTMFDQETAERISANRAYPTQTIATTVYQLVKEALDAREKAQRVE